MCVKSCLCVCYAKRKKENENNKFVKEIQRSPAGETDVDKTWQQKKKIAVTAALYMGRFVY